MNIVIIGANRGIGLGFIRHYLNEGHAVWGSYRQNKGELAAINDADFNAFVWDVTETASDLTLQSLPNKIDILINNAGIYGPWGGGQTLENITREGMREVFNVDCIGPLMTVQALKSRVIAAQGLIANISSKMGSSADNGSGGTYAYRAAKAALVMVSKSMAVDLAPHGVQVLTLHPGWVNTDMTHHSGLIDVTESVQGMTNVIAKAHQYSGGDFIAFDGQLIPY